jgi:hypothetical protein
VQDDRDDWDEESKKMADIYQGAFLTISALGAGQGEGLFLPRRGNGTLDDPDQRDVYEVGMDCIVKRNKPPIGEMHLALPLVKSDIGSVKSYIQAGFPVSHLSM